MIFEGYMEDAQSELELQFFNLIKSFFIENINGEAFILDITLFYKYNRNDLEKVVKELYTESEQSKMRNIKR